MKNYDIGFEEQIPITKKKIIKDLKKRKQLVALLNDGVPLAKARRIVAVQAINRFNKN